MAKPDTVYRFKKHRRQTKRSMQPHHGFGGLSPNAKKPFLPIVILLAVATFYLVWNVSGSNSWINSENSIAGNTQNRVASFAATDRESASFGYCDSGGGRNCVVDGDTLYYQGQKIRIADIDTPETHPPRCVYEAQLGAAATQRLHVLVNAGPFALRPIDRDEDVYGRKLRILTRNGESLGGRLVNEGLARWYGTGRKSWCE